ncbi:hypothetical protein SD71_15485 [Cohnella kolymensis]|uniref:HTH merR-type domain-containing protein n=1 Tax=Cohnella kolymensis TaxID=1590652 RepID=A0ABR5A230_9BACL|nr:MerR family transcriptional regulator [Cohnella kolymensis]KIL35061.1 hypothetical protein SD71_15485 [Cohnella kolymensis]
MDRTSISIHELAKQLNIPLATMRRYIRQHGHLLDLEKDDKNYTIGEDSISTLAQIREAYAQGLTVEEVQRRFSPTGFAPSAATGGTRGDSLYAEVMRAISDLEQLMIERFEQHNQLLNTLAETAAARLSDITRHDHDLQRLERIERVNDRLAEWRIERALQKEALEKWAALPEAQRLVKKGMFNKEEDREEKERFVRDYVDKYFETELRRAYGL